MKAVLALDQGTTSSRAILFDHSGQILAVAQKELEQHFPQPGWVEHDPDEIWSSQSGVAVDALARAGIEPREVAAVGITNQRETTIVWERGTGRPIYRAIVWQDRRTAGICERLKADGCESLFRSKTGLLFDPYFSGTKLKWILDNVPGARERARRGELAFGTVDSWLVWKLTEGAQHVTDVSNAARTLLFNIHTLQWDEDLLNLLDIPREILPEICESSQVYGEVGERTFFGGIPIAGLAGDQSAALFGQNCFSSGTAKNTYGTGCFLLMNTGSEPVASANNLLTTVAWKVDGRTEYALEGSIFIGGAAVQWLRDGLGIIRHSADVEPLAASVPDTGGVCVVPAFAGLGAPQWDPYARGAILGMTRGTTAAHIARATLQGIAHQCDDVLRAMQLDSGINLKELRVDGGACANNLLLQMQADLLQVPVIRPRVTETTALGAAYLAGLAVGFWKNKEEIAQQWEMERRFDPLADAGQVAQLRRTWDRAVSRAGNWEQL